MLSEWNDIVKVAAVDCANDDNTPLCRDYEIMAYPTVRYFSSNDNTKGFNIEKGKTVDDIRQELVKQLLKDQQGGKGITWPNLTPFRYINLFFYQSIHYVYFLTFPDEYNI